MTRLSVQQLTLSVDQAGRRLDHVLVTEFPAVPKTHWYRVLRRGEVRVNGGRIKPDYRVQAGDVVRIPPLDCEEKAPESSTSATFPDHQKRRILASILHEDDQVLVINKPSGLAVHGGSRLTIDVLSLLRASRADLADLPTLELVHRLDRETSGCLVLAKTHRSLRDLQAQFRCGDIVKTYWAVTAGHWPKATQRVNLPIDKHGDGGRDHRMVVDPEGQQAISDFTVVESFREAQWVKVGLKTGRTHQIRVHSSAMEHPIAGDDKYGDRAFNRAMQKRGLRRLFLHARQITLTLASGVVTLTAPLEASLESFLKTVREGNSC